MPVLLQMPGPQAQQSPPAVTATVEYKCWFYEAAKAAGTVDVPGAMADADVPDQFRAIRQELRGQKIPNGEKSVQKILFRESCF